MKTLKIEPTHRASQGDYVEINAEDYNPAIHTLIEGETLPVIVGNVVHKVEVFLKAEGESLVDFAERVSRHFAPMFFSLTDDERGQLSDRLGDLAPPVLSPPGPADEPAADAPKAETKAQKAARLAQEAAAAEAPPPAPPADPAPAPAPGWGTPAAT
jgi:hypothetical protein